MQMIERQKCLVNQSQSSPCEALEMVKAHIYQTSRGKYKNANDDHRDVHGFDTLELIAVPHIVY